ncbi:trimethylamine methyltransferase, partial [Mesorhizobium sp. M7A.F.Ca.CA.001.13.2.1]
YRTAFYEPLVADWSNFGNWTQSGSKTASERATGVWRRVLADFAPPTSAVATSGVLDEFIARRTAEGGAAPVS